MSSKPSQTEPTASRIAWPMVFVFLFVGFLVASALMNRLPWLVVVAYGVMSLATFVVYGLDKSKAQQGKWRIPESTLHLMGLLGGWPGGLAGQRLFRHKSSKVEFLLVFWGTVVLNVMAVGYLVWIDAAGFIDQWISRLS